MAQFVGEALLRWRENAPNWHREWLRSDPTVKKCFEVALAETTSADRTDFRTNLGELSKTLVHQLQENFTRLSAELTKTNLEQLAIARTWQRLTRWALSLSSLALVVAVLLIGRRIWPPPKLRDLESQLSTAAMKAKENEGEIRFLRGYINHDLHITKVRITQDLTGALWGYRSENLPRIDPIPAGDGAGTWVQLSPGNEPTRIQ